MILSTYGREYYAVAITTLPATDPTDWEASFDGGATFFDATSVNGNSAWLVAGPSADATGAVAVLTRPIVPKVRLIADPEVVVRSAPRINLTA